MSDTSSDVATERPHGDARGTLEALQRAGILTVDGAQIVRRLGAPITLFDDAATHHIRAIFGS